MTDKSTPGPWIVDEDHKGMGEVRVYESAWKSPAPSPRLVAVFGNAENDHERKAADARLGAAAPELYEASIRSEAFLKGISIELSCYLADPNVYPLDIKPLLHQAASIHRDLQSALAKAEGEK